MHLRLDVADASLQLGVLVRVPLCQKWRAVGRDAYPAVTTISDLCVALSLAIQTAGCGELLVRPAGDAGGLGPARAQTIYDQQALAIPSALSCN